jgi:hypothetical protein
MEDYNRRSGLQSRERRRPTTQVGVAGQPEKYNLIQPRLGRRCPEFERETRWRQRIDVRYGFCDSQSITRGIPLCQIRKEPRPRRRVQRIRTTFLYKSEKNGWKKYVPCCQISPRSFKMGCRVQGPRVDTNKWSRYRRLQVTRSLKLTGDR